MTKGKILGFTFGGFAGFLLMSKAMNAFEHTIESICDARKWTYYYKYGVSDEVVVPPGYELRMTTDIDNESDNVRKVDIVKHKRSETVENSTLGKAIKSSVGDAIEKKIIDAIDGVKTPRGASEGQTEASEENNPPETEKEEAENETDDDDGDKVILMGTDIYGETIKIPIQPDPGLNISCDCGRSDDLEATATPFEKVIECHENGKLVVE